MPKGSIVAAGHPLTAEAAAHALGIGGNACDALLSGWLTACLAEPVLTSPAGGGFAMLAPSSGKIRLYDFFTQTPSTRSGEARMYPLEADFGTTRQVFHLGAGSVAVPGCIAGILRIHAEHGRLPMKACAAPAMDYARSGISVTSHAAKLLEVVSALYRATPEARAVFGSRIQPGACLVEGEVFTNSDYADFLETLVSEGSRWFYEGDIGRLIAAHCEAKGGHLKRSDFEAYEVFVREPLVLTHAGSRIWLNPPPSMGGFLIGCGLRASSPRSQANDPGIMTTDWENWTRPLRLMTLLRTRDGFRRLIDSEPSLIQSVFNGASPLRTAAESLFPQSYDLIRERGTTHISIIDREGTAVSMTTSNGSGSAVILPGTGFMLNNMLGEEDLQPEGANTWVPGCRLASMMCPTLVQMQSGGLVATGSGGSNRIRSTLLQILRHLTENKSALEPSILAPRLHWENAVLHAEESAGPLDRFAQSKGWECVSHGIPNLFFGGAHSVARDINGSLTGVGDPRRGGAVRAV